MSQARVDRTPSSFRAGRSRTKDRHYLSAGDRVEAKVEADDRRRGVRLDVEALAAPAVRPARVALS